MEAVLKRELTNLGLTIRLVEDGRVTYMGDEAAIARANMFLRTTERVMIQVGRFRAETFDELFEKIKALPWEQFIPKNGKFWVTKANSIKSKLFSPSDIQSITKKAMVERLKQKYGISWFDEDGAEYPVRISILKDEVIVGLDTSGTSLHKRGYRKMTAKAPITETLAAAIILLTPWNRDRILVDPFCGSGTIPIEAAMIGTDTAPGIARHFLYETWDFMGPMPYKRALAEANDRVIRDCRLSIQGYDIDEEVLRSARANARLAGYENRIHLQQRDVRDLSHPKRYGFIITNPPYGERLEEKEALPYLYTEIGKAFSALDSWSYFIITSYGDAEKYIGRKADKNRKIYNGMIKTYLYSYMGPKPSER